MDCLKTHLQEMSSDEKAKFASKCGTTIGYLKKIFSTGSLLGPAICVAIERATDSKVTRQDLRPDDYWLIWPELADSEVA